MKSRKGLYLATCLMTFIIIMAATIGNSWTSMKTTVSLSTSTRMLEETIEEGLWKVCFYSEINSFLHGCKTVEDTAVVFKKDIEAWFHTCRAFSIMACLASITGTLLVLASFCFVLNHTRVLVSISFVASTIFLTVTVAIYTAEFEKAKEFASGPSLIPDDTDYGWCYISAWIGIILSAVHAIAAFYMEKKSPYAV